VSDSSVEGLPISIGVIEGGWTPSMPAWRAALKELTEDLAQRRLGITTPLRVNVIYQVRGNLVQPDFEGVRTGYYGKRQNCLIVQAAVPEDAPEDPYALLWKLLIQAVHAAEEWAKRRKLASSLSDLDELVTNLRPSSRGGPHAG
jgi:hypothetical protein